VSEQEKITDNRLEVALFLAVVSSVLALAHFTVGAWNAEQTNQRLQRIEKIVGIDEIGRRK
jgi:hypothetical protein